MAITDAELRLIAKAAIIGDSSQPVKGYSNPARNLHIVSARGKLFLGARGGTHAKGQGKCKAAENKRFDHDEE
nr:hypothetical protein [Acidovorax sp. KKS102]